MFTALVYAGRITVKLETLLQSLNLIHKYDCESAKRLTAKLAAKHFDHVDPGSSDLPCEPWKSADGVGKHLVHDQIEQVHLDFIIRVQDLWNDMLTPSMVRILARTLACCLKSRPGDIGQYMSMVNGHGVGWDGTLFHKRDALTSEKDRDAATSESPPYASAHRGIRTSVWDGKSRAIQLHTSEKVRGLTPAASCCDCCKLSSNPA